MLRGCSLNSHEHYEELCALAASGQASQPDWRILGLTSKPARVVEAWQYDFTEVSAQGLSCLRRSERRQIPSGMTQRFVARRGPKG